MSFPEASAGPDVTSSEDQVSGFKALFRKVCVAMTLFNFIAFCSFFKMANILHALVLPNGAEVARKFAEERVSIVTLSVWCLLQERGVMKSNRYQRLKVTILNTYTVLLHSF